MIVITGILGLFVGSFFGVIIDRLYHDERGILFGRSTCDACKKVLSWRDLMPLSSYIFSKGKSRCCAAPLSFWLPIFEITTAGAFMLFAAEWGSNAQYIPHIILGLLALLMGLYDARYMIVDRRISFPAIFFSLFFGIFIQHFSVVELLASAIVGGGFYALQYWISGGKWVGKGDTELGVFMGLALGYNVFRALLVSYWIGVIVIIPLILLTRAGRKTPVPMGAFLMLSLILFLLYETNITRFITMISEGAWY